MGMSLVYSTVNTDANNAFNFSEVIFSFCIMIIK